MANTNVEGKCFSTIYLIIGSLLVGFLLLLLWSILLNDVLNIHNDIANFPSNVSQELFGKNAFDRKHPAFIIAITPSFLLCVVGIAKGVLNTQSEIDFLTGGLKRNTNVY